jgi:HK97 family phage prohead protease
MSYYSIASGYITKSDDQGVVDGVVSSEAPDRMGDIIRIDSWDTREYLRNPVLMVNHDYQQLPVGIAQKVWKEGKKLMARFQLDIEDAEIASIFRRIKKGILRAFSVGFREISSNPRYNASGQVIGKEFTKVELLEISLVGIPANSEALVTAVKQFTEIPPLVKRQSYIGQLISDALIVGDYRRVNELEELWFRLSHDQPEARSELIRLFVENEREERKQTAKPTYQRKEPTWW